MVISAISDQRLHLIRTIKFYAIRGTTMNHEKPAALTHSETREEILYTWIFCNIFYSV